MIGGLVLVDGIVGLWVAMRVAARLKTRIRAAAASDARDVRDNAERVSALEKWRKELEWIAQLTATGNRSQDSS